MNNKTLIICASMHHGNTAKIAEAIGGVLNAKIIKPGEFDIESVSDYALIGFGSGIYNRKHHKSLFDLVGRLKAQNHKKAFIFSTSTITFADMHKPLKESLADKGFDIIGEFRCKGFMSYSFTKYIFGGLNKGRPNEEDLKKAKDFAREMNDKISQVFLGLLQK